MGFNAPHCVQGDAGGACLMRVSVELPDDLVIQLLEDNDKDLEEVIHRAVELYRLTPEADLTLHEAGRFDDQACECTELREP